MSGQRSTWRACAAPFLSSYHSLPSDAHQNCLSLRAVTMPTADSKGKKPAISTTQAAALSATPRPSHTSPAPRLTTFQLKAIKALSEVTSKDREPKPKLSEWKLPQSDDPNVELMVFPLQNFEGYKPGGKAGTSAKSKSSKSSDENDDSEEDESSEDDVETQAQASASSSQGRASQHQVKQNASGRTPTSKPQVGSSSKTQLNFGFKPELAKDSLPAWPGAYEKEHSASEGEQTNSGSSSQGESETSGEGDDGGQVSTGICAPSARLSRSHSVYLSHLGRPEASALADHRLVTHLAPQLGKPRSLSPPAQHEEADGGARGHQEASTARAQVYHGLPPRCSLATPSYRNLRVDVQDVPGRS